jgi:serine/threonine-protein kinase
MPAQAGPSSPVVEPLGVDPVVGEYRVLRRLGKGGMCDVYEAVHTLIGKRVALKVLSHEAAARPEAAQRFLLEAQTVNAIGHPNIVDIFGFGELGDGRKYFVMELLEGEPLSSHLKAHAPLPAQDVVELLDQILDALGAVHAAGIVHRDLKPANIFLVNAARGGRYVKLLDFGIAKELKVERNLTGSFDVLGTPQYMAPEQARGTATTRSDLYSLGCIAFLMLTGQHVFKANNFVDLVSLHLTQPPPRPSTLAGGIPTELEDVVLKLLEKDPSNRPKDTLAVRARLAEIRRNMKGAQTMVVRAPPTRPASGTPAPPFPPPPPDSATAQAVDGQARKTFARAEHRRSMPDAETREPASPHAILLAEPMAPRPVLEATRDAATTDTSTPSLGDDRLHSRNDAVDLGLARPRRWPWVVAFAVALAAVVGVVMRPSSSGAEGASVGGPASPTAGALQQGLAPGAGAVRGTVGDEGKPVSSEDGLTGSRGKGGAPGDDPTRGAAAGGGAPASPTAKAGSRETNPVPVAGVPRPAERTKAKTGPVGGTPRSATGASAPARNVSQASLARELADLRAHTALVDLPRSARLLLDDISDRLAKAKTDAELRAVATDMREWRASWGGPH